MNVNCREKNDFKFLRLYKITNWGYILINDLFFYLRRAKTLSLIIILSAFFASAISFSQVNYSANQNWKWLHPKTQGNTLRWCKAWDKNNWYMAGGYGTFMKTTDGGLSWSIFYNSYGTGSNFPDDTRGDFLDAYFFNQNTGILITSYGTVYKTTNAGSNSVTFDSIPGMFVNPTPYNHIFFLNNNTGYIAANVGRLYKTTNGGNNWTLITSISSANHNDVWTPDDILIIVSSAGGNIQRSTDGGTTWQTISTGSSVNLQKLCFTSNDTGFVCGNSSSVRLTTDGGLSWANINTGLATSNFIDLDYKINGSSKEIYLTGNAQYIYKTTNFGTSWDTLGIWGANQTNMGAFQRYYSTELMGGDTILTSGSYGLINKRNSITDRTLYTSFVKFGAANVNDIWVQDSKILAVGNPTITGTTFDQIIFSLNGGDTWDAANVGSSTTGFNSISMANSNTGYIAGTEGRIRKTINGGLTWDSLVSPTTDWLHKVDFIDVNTGWIFTVAGTIYKTTDGGSNWAQQNSTINGFYRMDADMLDANTGWFAGFTAGFPTPSYVYKTTDGGTNWSQQYFTNTAVFISIKMLDNSTGYVGGAGILRKTTNGGTNWDSLTVPLINYQIVGMDFINSQTGIALCGYNTLKTTSGGASWSIDYLGSTAGISSSPCKIRMVSQDTAYAVGNLAGVFKYSQGPIGIIEWQTGVPEKYELFQNYPNPFNPSTTIKFTLPKAGNVTLKLYDITGQEVATIIDNMGLNPGTVTHQFDGSEYASGIYFYSLYVDGNLIDSKKMILIK